MTISIKIKKKQLDTLIVILQDQEVLKPTKIPKKCRFYLFSSALKKLLKKQIDKADDFSNKAFSISFSYAEATSIYLELSKIKDLYGIYESNLILVLKNDLHQKLEK